MIETIEKVRGGIRRETGAGVNVDNEGGVNLLINVQEIVHYRREAATTKLNKRLTPRHKEWEFLDEGGYFGC